MNETLTDWVAQMMNRLVEQGVEDIVISPGSRSMMDSNDAFVSSVA